MLYRRGLSFQEQTQNRDKLLVGEADANGFTYQGMCVNIYY